MTSIKPSPALKHGCAPLVKCRDFLSDDALRLCIVQKWRFSCKFCICYFSHSIITKRCFVRASSSRGTGVALTEVVGKIPTYASHGRRHETTECGRFHQGYVGWKCSRGWSDGLHRASAYAFSRLLLLEIHNSNPLLRRCPGTELQRQHSLVLRLGENEVWMNSRENERLFALLFYSLVMNSSRFISTRATITHAAVSAAETFSVAGVLQIARTAA